MRKILILLIAMIFLLTSCSLRGPIAPLYHENDQSIADNTFAKLVDMIKNHDENELKALFSETTRNEASDFDTQITDFLNYIEGEIVSFHSDMSVGAHIVNEYGTKRKEIEPVFYLETTEQDYYIALIECIRDDFDPNNIGISSLYIISTENWTEPYLYRGDGEWVPGIHIDPGPVPEPVTDFTFGEFRYRAVENGIYIIEYLGNDSDVVIPAEIDGMPITELGEYAFYRNQTIKSVQIPETVRIIRSKTFHGCSSLESVFLPANLQQIDYNPFIGCLSLTEIKVDDENPVFCDVEGVLHDKEKTKFLIYPEGRRTESYAILPGVTAIAEAAFGYEPPLEKIMIPSSVETFPDHLYEADPDDTVLIVEPNSTALAYAQENSFRYEIRE